MSTLEFRIDDWVQVEDPDQRRSCTSAELIICVDDIPVTRLLDSWSRTVTDRARVPLYPMAEWFATNWWRLHEEAPYEGGGYLPLDWRLSHDLTAIGGGIVWPRVRFASDDQTIQVSARAVRNALWEPVRHLNDIQPARAVKVESFDQAVEELVNVVLLRLKDVGVSAEPLATIWADVLAERIDIEVVEWRKWEARLGYDPEQAPDRLMKQVASLFGTAGKPATAEVAPLLNSKRPAMLGRLETLAASGGIEARLPMRAMGNPPAPQLAPWEAGREMAHLVRHELRRKEGPLDNRILSDLLGMRVEAFDQLPARDLPIGLGVRNSDRNDATLHFRKRNPTGMRFEAARFLADSLSAPEEDLWLPLTDRGTARQKFQRAFAAELLAPIKEISELLGNSRTSERFEDVADQYEVSPLTIRSHLANHGMLTPEEVVV